MRDETLARVSAVSGSEAGVLIAFSGGMDSTVLAHLMRDAPFPVASAHVHHGLRASADVDARFCADVSRVLGLYHKEIRLQINAGNSTQMQARIQRYAALASAVEEMGFGLLLTAHHLDDQLEFLEISRERKSRFHPLSLSSFMSDFGVRVCRPFHDVDRLAIETHARQNQIRWVEDPSNQSLEYQRNRIRAGLTRDRRAALLEQFFTSDEKTSIPVERLSATTHRVRLSKMSAGLTDDWRALVSGLPGASVSADHVRSLMQTPQAGRVDASGCELVSDGTYVSASTAPNFAPAEGVISGEHGQLPWFGDTIEWSVSSPSKYRCEPGFTITGPMLGEKFERRDGRFLKIRELLREVGVPASERWRWPCLRDLSGKCIALLGTSYSSEASASMGVSVRGNSEGMS